LQQFQGSLARIGVTLPPLVNLSTSAALSSMAEKVDPVFALKHVFAQLDSARLALPAVVDGA
jgi:hypothetical protein